MGMVSIAVCGGRDYSDRATVNRVMSEVVTPWARALCVEVIHGGAPGADTLAAEWAKANRFYCVEFKADWAKHGRAAGPIRNQQMIEHRPVELVAFPGGRGTADMVRRAKAAGIRVHEIQPKDTR